MVSQRQTSNITAFDTAEAWRRLEALPDSKKVLVFSKIAQSHTVRAAAALCLLLLSSQEEDFDPVATVLPEGVQLPVDAQEAYKLGVIHALEAVGYLLAHSDFSVEALLNAVESLADSAKTISDTLAPEAEPARPVP